MYRAAQNLVFIVVIGWLPLAAPAQSPEGYLWPHRTPTHEDRLARRISVPPGYLRTSASAGSFAEWLRGLPLQPGTGIVRLHGGNSKPTQDSHVAVIDIDVGSRDLQQCADAVIRLRAEYLFARGAHSEISFRFTSGDVAAYVDWRRGSRPTIDGNRVRWSARAHPDDSYAGFRSYLDTVFTYAGTISLRRDLMPVATGGIRIGDVIVQAGSPGHAMLVVDVAENQDGERIMLLAQSYMPAQSIHIVRNPGGRHDPWYEVEFGDALVTPDWTFGRDDVRRFADQAQAGGRKDQTSR